MPKYTKLLPPHEYEKLTLEEKEEYIIEMAQLLKPRIVRPDDPPGLPPDTQPDNQPDATPPLDDEPKLP